jgi:hypothetical protein
MKHTITMLGLYILPVFFFMFNNMMSSNVGLNDIMQGMQMAQSIYNDFKIATSKGIDIDSSLTDFERDNRYKLLFTNYVKAYSMKNSKIARIDGADYDVFRDTYKSIEEGLYIYLGKSKADLKKEWAKSPSKSDYIIDQVGECLFILNKKKEYQKKIVMITEFQDILGSLLLDYAQEEANLKNILNRFMDLEEKVSGLTDIEKLLFDNFINGKVMTEKELYQLFNIILSGEAILEYKNRKYIEKKKSLDNIMIKIVKLIGDINVLIEKKDSLLSSDNVTVYKNSDNTLAKGAKNNKEIKKILSEMDIIIETGNKSPGQTSQVLPGVALLSGIRDGAKRGGFVGAIKGGAEGFAAGVKNLGKKIGGMLGF